MKILLKGLRIDNELQKTYGSLRKILKELYVFLLHKLVKPNGNLMKKHLLGVT